MSLLTPFTRIGVYSADALATTGSTQGVEAAASQDDGRLLHMASVGMRRDQSVRRALPSTTERLHAEFRDEAQRRARDTRSQKMTVERDISSELFRKDSLHPGNAGSASTRRVRGAMPRMPAALLESEHASGHMERIHSVAPASLRTSAPQIKAEPRPVQAHALNPGASNSGSEFVQYRSLE